MTVIGIKICLIRLQSANKPYLCNYMKLSFVLPKPMSKLLSKSYQDEQTACTKIDCGMGFWKVADGISVTKTLLSDCK